MIEIVNKLLLAEDKFMLEMLERQPGYTNSAWVLVVHSLKTKKGWKKFKKQKTRDIVI